MQRYNNTEQRTTMKASVKKSRAVDTIPNEDSSVSSKASSTTAPSDASQRIFFPLRLHALVSDKTTDEIIRWLPSGKAFLIVDKKRFASELLPQFFPQSCQFTSFTRKLSRWRFNRIPRGPLIGAYHHKLFVKDDREKCYHMNCKSFPASDSSPAPSAPQSPVSTMTQVFPSMVARVSPSPQALSDVMPRRVSNDFALKALRAHIETTPQVTTPASQVELLLQNVPMNSRQAFQEGIKKLAELDACIHALQLQQRQAAVTAPLSFSVAPQSPVPQTMQLPEITSKSLTKLAYGNIVSNSNKKVEELLMYANLVQQQNERISNMIQPARTNSKALSTMEQLLKLQRLGY